jgi:cell division protein FtsI (penicillin-binding protein 3)/stage V sporulation protein D (sporulation-specific penicillin-binding protein)
VSFTSQSRALIACCGLTLAFTGFSARLVQLQVTQHDEYYALAAENHGGRQLIFARRGTIEDSRGLPLAQNEPVKTVVADASLIKDRDALVSLLAGPLEMPENVLRDKLSRERWSDKEGKNVPLRYIVLRKELPEASAVALAAKLSEAHIRAITFEQDFVRVYPNGEMGCHVVGYTDHTNAGVDGVEKTMDDYLRGHDGFRYTEHDRTGKEMVPYRGAERPARDGNTVRLTLDSGLQMIVESELEAAVKQYRPKGAVSIVMRPQTGEVLAMANWPHYNPNDQEGVAPERRKNIATESLVEPGSTFKIVTVAGALSQKLVTPETPIDCENGHYLYGGKVLHDSHPHGVLTVSEVLEKSSNIGAAKLGIQMGDQKLYEQVRRFGFGERTGIALPGEVSGIIHPPHRWSKISITHVPMGQEVAVTPLQMATAMCAVANGGHLMVPQIIHEIVDPKGNIVSSFPPTEVRRVMSDQTSEQLRTALAGVVSKKGTAQLAHVRGFKVAGKTGTAQKPGPNGTYEHGKYVTSFIGFLPADKPEFVCLVMVDDANTKPNENYGGTVAAPVFAKIAERTAQHLDLIPDPAQIAEYDATVPGEHMRD